MRPKADSFWDRYRNHWRIDTARSDLRSRKTLQKHTHPHRFPDTMSSSHSRSRSIGDLCRISGRRRWMKRPRSPHNRIEWNRELLQRTYSLHPGNRWPFRMSRIGLRNRRNQLPDCRCLRRFPGTSCSSHYPLGNCAFPGRIPRLHRWSP